jgi:hypothetical protein
VRGCREARGWLERSLDGRLALEEEFRLEAHLRACARCRGAAGRARLVEEALQRLPEPPLRGCAPDERSIEGALARIHAGIASRPSAPRRMRLTPVGALAAAAASLAALALARALVSPPRGTGEGEAPAARAIAAPDVPRVPRAERGAEPVPEDLAGPAREPGVPLAPPPARGAAPRPSGALEPHRLDEARHRVRRALATALAVPGTPAQAERRFEEQSRAVQQDGWPVTRLLEELLDDEDPDVARGAATALGRRGDRISAGPLARALARPEIRASALAALGALGEEGIAGLAQALHDPSVRAQALLCLGRIGGPRAAEVIERELVRAGTERDPDEREEERRVLLARLAATGTSAVRSLVRLAERGHLPEARALACLGTIPGGGAALAAELRPGRAATPFLLAAVERLRPEAALPWVEELCRASNRRDEALRCLAGWPGERALATCLRLAREGRVPRGALVETVRAQLALDSEAALRLADLLSVARDGQGAAVLLDLLLEAEAPAGASALAHLALAAPLSDDERQWAALAVGELGDERDAERLERGLLRLGAEQKRLRAACLLSIHALAGERGAERALASLRLHDFRPLLAELHRASERGSPAVDLYRVARALDDASLPETPESHP